METNKVDSSANYSSLGILIYVPGNDKDTVVAGETSFFLEDNQWYYSHIPSTKYLDRYTKVRRRFHHPNYGSILAKREQDRMELENKCAVLIVRMARYLTEKSKRNKNGEPAFKQLRCCIRL